MATLNELIDCDYEWTEAKRCGRFGNDGWRWYWNGGSRSYKQMEQENVNAGFTFGW